MVRKNRIKKYMTRMGQNTGTLKKSKNVVKIAMRVDITVCSLKIENRISERERKRERERQRVVYYTHYYYATTALIHSLLKTNLALTITRNVQ